MPSTGRIRRGVGDKRTNRRSTAPRRTQASAARWLAGPFLLLLAVALYPSLARAALSLSAHAIGEAWTPSERSASSCRRSRQSLLNPACDAFSEMELSRADPQL